jgi:hypothetical protein
MEIIIYFTTTNFFHHDELRMMTRFLVMDLAVRLLAKRLGLGGALGG